MKPKYVSIKKLIDADYQYNILLGQRSNGKSYAVKQHVLTNFWKTGKRFVYLRRYQLEVKASDAEAYFRDAPVEAITGGEYSMVTIYRGGVFLSKMDEAGKVIRGKQCGYVAYLSNETHFKSQNFNDVSDVIYEEFITDQGYLYREPEKLESIISTIARKRKIKVWLIGNTISRLCPYFSEWGLIRIPKQEQGTIDVYEHLTDQVDEDTGDPVTIRIAVYFCEQTANTSKMFFGSSAGMITKGTWQTRSYPHLPYHYKDCQKLYELIYKHLEFTFKVEALKSKDKGEYMAFVHPHNDPDYEGRIISDQASPSPLVTRKLDPVRKGDLLLRMCFSSGKVFYSDNLTGADWEACLADGDFL